MNGPPIIVLFRQDLRLADNPALIAAAKTGRPIIPAYILDETGDWPIGGASRWWLHHSLLALSKSLTLLGASLVLRRGPMHEALLQLVKDSGAQSVFWNRLYEPDFVARDSKIKTSLGVEIRSFNAALIREPWEIKTGAGTPFRVFTPFFRALSASLQEVEVEPAPKRLVPSIRVQSDSLDDWRLTPSQPNWANNFSAVWRPGEDGAQRRLGAFLDRSIVNYDKDRDRPSVDGTSRLSPHLHFGEISPRQIWRAASPLGSPKGIDKFKAELGWREFSYHLLYHAPGLPHANLRLEFDAFPWREDEQLLTAWRQGKTGVPIVDAGMRELWATGWMHNRVRMIVASFLVKNLLIDWRHGARWFWDTLVDADLASNSASWQWVAGCGADAAPFFRIFNPILQGRKFDADGSYVRKWVPELSSLSDEIVHSPWLGDTSKLTEANVEMGRNYPFPIADLAASRTRALAAFAQLKSAA